MRKEERQKQLLMKMKRIEYWQRYGELPTNKDLF